MAHGPEQGTTQRNFCWWWPSQDHHRASGSTFYFLIFLFPSLVTPTPLSSDLLPQPRRPHLVNNVGFPGPTVDKEFGRFYWKCSEAWTMCVHRCPLPRITPGWPPAPPAPPRPAPRVSRPHITWSPDCSPSKMKKVWIRVKLPTMLSNNVYFSTIWSSLKQRNYNGAIAKPIVLSRNVPVAANNINFWFNAFSRRPAVLNSLLFPSLLLSPGGGANISSREPQLGPGAAHPEPRLGQHPHFGKK